MPKPIVIVGSINMDLVCRTPRMPRAGETLLGSAFHQIPGGKGANQAVAAARLADGRTPVHMIGRVGDDPFGTTLRDGLRQNGVDVAHVTVTENSASGVALIFVDDAGENSITVVAGANSHLSPTDIDAAKDVIASAACVVMQLEVPTETIRYTIDLCRRLNVFTILDPAPVPAGGMVEELFAVDLLTPNQTEAALLLGRSLPPGETAEQLQKKGSRSVVLKLGSQGSMSLAGGTAQTVGPFAVKAVDTTAAGDAFTGGLAVAFAEGMSTVETLRFANAAGAICCQTLGAQPALPRRSAVERLLHPVK